MDTQVLEYLTEKLREELRAVEEELARGGASDFAEYKRMCGVAQGLLTAQREINDLLRKVKEHDDSL